MSTSSAQTAANQQNAKFSTGPRTDSGKTVSSQNGLSHGLSSQFAVLGHESQTGFDALAAALRADLKPEGEHETFLTDQMIQARWRLARIDRLEAAAFDAILDPEANANIPEARIIAYMGARKNADILATLQRYAAAAERSYHKNYRELLYSRQISQKMYQKAMDNYVKNVVYAPVPGQPLPEQKLPAQNGFASQSASNSTVSPTSAAQPDNVTNFQPKH